MPPSSGFLASIRRHALKVSVGFLVLSALVAIAAVLTGDFGDFEVRVLMSTFTIAVTSICALIASAYGQRAAREPVALLGLALSVLAALLILLGIWVEIDDEAYWKTAAVLGIFAVAAAHVMTLVMVPLPEPLSWLRNVARLVIWALAAVLAGTLVLEIESDGIFRLMAALSILVALVTVVIPVIGRLQRDRVDSSSPVSSPRQASPDELHLVRQDDGTWQALDGRRFQVHDLPDN
jgi:hypothetical protein